jgi:hypothetical protein
MFVCEFSCFGLIASRTGVTSHKKLHCPVASRRMRNSFGPATGAHAESETAWAGEPAHPTITFAESFTLCPIKSLHCIHAYFVQTEVVTLLARPIKKLKLFPTVCRFMALGGPVVTDIPVRHKQQIQRQRL